MDIYFDHAETHMVYEYTSWIDLDLLSPMGQFVSVPGTYSDDLASVGCPSAVLTCWRPCRSRDDFYPDDLGR